MTPTNHRLAERKLIGLVASGKWRIDDGGHVWRITKKRGWVAAEKRLPSGYVMVRSMIDGVRVCGSAHRLVWQFVHGDIPEGLVINHKNGLKDCNRIGNLEVCTYSENSRHAYRTGLKDQHGERNPASTLSDHDVGVIRAAYAAGGLTMLALAARFGCAFQTISRIVRGHSRLKQAGEVASKDLRHSVCENDVLTGRFLAPRPAVPTP